MAPPTLMTLVGFIKPPNVIKVGGATRAFNTEVESVLAWTFCGRRQEVRSGELGNVRKKEISF